MAHAGTCSGSRKCCVLSSPSVFMRKGQAPFGLISEGISVQQKISSLKDRDKNVNVENNLNRYAF